MKRLLLVAALFCSLPSPGWSDTVLVKTNTNAQASTWETNYQKAQERAGQENKLLLLYFTGSDWCPWCQRVQAEILSQPEFQDFAQEHFVLVKIDFPQQPLEGEQRQQNETLKNRYFVRGFPTFIVVGRDERARWGFGYLPGGAPAMIEKLRPFLRELTPRQKSAASKSSQTDQAVEKIKISDPQTPKENPVRAQRLRP